MAKSKPEKYKSRADWLDKRGIGGSDIGALMGMSSWKEPNDVITEKRYGSNDKTNELLENGTKAEPHIRELFALCTKTEYEVADPPKRGAWLFRHKDYKYMTCSPDGIIKDLRTGQRGGLEIKFADCFGRKAFEKWDNQIPPQYYAQCCWYMAVIPELEFVILDAYLKFYENYEDGWRFDHAETRLYTIYREDAKDFIAQELAKAKEAHEYEEQRLLMPQTITITLGDSEQ